MILKPAPGKDYNTPLNVAAAWYTGETFIIRDVSANEWNGRRVNVDAFAHGSKVTIVFDRERQSTEVTGKPRSRGVDALRHVNSVVTERQKGNNTLEIRKGKTVTKRAVVRRDNSQEDETLAAIANMLKTNPQALERINELMQAPTRIEVEDESHFETAIIEKWSGHLKPQRVVIIKPDKGAQLKMGLASWDTIILNIEEALEFNEQLNEIRAQDQLDAEEEQDRNGEDEPEDAEEQEPEPVRRVAAVAAKSSVVKKNVVKKSALGGSADKPYVPLSLLAANKLTR